MGAAEATSCCLFLLIYPWLSCIIGKSEGERSCGCWGKRVALFFNWFVVKTRPAEGKLLAVASPLPAVGGCVEGTSV